MNNMKFIDIIFQKFRFVCILFLCLLCSGVVNAKENTDKKVKDNAIGVSLVVVDPAGNPISNANIVVGEGIIHTETDAQGVSNFRAFLSDMVTITSRGYEKEVTTVGQVLKNKTIQLHKAKLFMTSDDNVPLPFMTMKKRFITGSESVIDGDMLEKYPSTDLRNALTGQATGLEVVEKYGIPGMSAEEKLGNFGAMEKVSLSVRGRSPIWIIDDVPTDITEMQLDPQEVESVTVLKDIVAKAMFGPQAADGAIFVKTKRGIKNDRILSVNVESGVSVIDRMPEFVSGA
ncbi:MAG: TonB-dependent receptor plug domain-containing protein, partial [Bacteroidota bacterium]|nr:TonB-dependent receptor plug domain-containing protein [Bacteroidota bacterium]